MGGRSYRSSTAGMYRDKGFRVYGVFLGWRVGHGTKDTGATTTNNKYMGIS